MVVRKQCPQIYWSQTDGEVNLYVDLFLDDVVCSKRLRFICKNKQ